MPFGLSARRRDLRLSAPRRGATASLVARRAPQLGRQLELAVEAAREASPFVDRDRAAAQVAADARPRDEPNRARCSDVSLQRPGDRDRLRLDRLARDAT